MPIIKIVCLLIMTGVSTIVAGQEMYSGNPRVIGNGKRMFEQYCSSCHNFSQKSIGPSLHRATTENSRDWLEKFIRNAAGMIASGEEKSRKLFEEYGHIMPPFQYLKDSELDAILSYIHQNQSEQAAVSDSADGHVHNPISEKIRNQGGQLHLQYHSTAPLTSQQAPLARINKMQVLPGKQERLFVVDLVGVLYEIVGRDWVVALDVRESKPHFTSFPGLGTGFGSFAFHPDFKRNKLLYTTHAEKPVNSRGDLSFADTIEVGLQWVLTEWTISDPVLLPFKTKSREVLRIDMLTTSHGVQEIAFNPISRKEDQDYGLLYIGIGDGGSAEKKGYYQLCASNKMVAGSVLRIDPLGDNSANRQYGIPPDNPYVGAEDPELKKEIFCRGLRNPNRISWTPGGKMLIHDIGQANIEEINIGIAGADYGWPEREGSFRVDPRNNINQVFSLPDSEEAGTYTYPVLQYDHDEGRAISGGFVYEGKAAPGLTGKYIFSDITNGRVFLAESDLFGQSGQVQPEELEISVDGKPTTFQQMAGPAKPDIRLGVGPGRELYFFSKADGRLYHVTGYTPPGGH